MDLTVQHGASTGAVVTRLRAAGCVFAEREAAVLAERAAGDAALLDELTARRCAGEPLEVVVGYADFGGVRVAVRAGVFVPRARSIALVERAAMLLRPRDPDDRIVVDLGCGTGALGAAVLARVPAQLVACDVDPVAVTCARATLTGTGATVEVGDLFETVPTALRGRVAVVLANLPYVPTAAIDLLPREARDYEATAALDGGPDGLGPLRRAVAGLHPWLRPDGAYLAEVHESQLAAVVAYARALGFVATASTDPDDGTTLVELRPAGVSRSTPPSTR